MTFAEILSAVYDECQYASSPAAAIVTRMKRLANEGVRVILGEPGLSRLADSDQPLTFTTTASTARYVLPEAVEQIKHLTERTNDQALTVMSLEDYRAIDPDATSSTGTPVRYVPIGRVAVATQPSDASSLFVKSTDAADTTQTAFVEGIITGGYLRTASVALNGTTAANLSAAISTFIEVTDFYLSAAPAGGVTLHEDSGAGTELARITIGATRPKYYGFYLWPTPAATVTYYVDYRRRIVDMVNNTDEPPLTEDAHPMLVAYVVKREMANKPSKTNQYADATLRYQKFLDNLKYETQTLSDDLPVAGRGRWVGRSRLGAMYPADMYVRG